MGLARSEHRTIRRTEPIFETLTSVQSTLASLILTAGYSGTISIGRENLAWVENALGVEAGLNPLHHFYFVRGACQ